MLNLRYAKHFEHSVFSQNGEDGVLQVLLQACANVDYKCLEIGVGTVGDKIECNTAALLALGWDGLLIDANKEAVSRDSEFHRFFMSKKLHPKTIISELKETLIQKDLLFPDVFSLDIDGYDYWMLRELLTNQNQMNFLPSIIIVEYNPEIYPTKSLTVPLTDEDFVWDGSDYYGASAGAFVELAHKIGYKLICDTNHVNLFFLWDADVPRSLVEPDLTTLGGRLGRTYRRTNKQFVTPPKL
jgi:hypothetical protein